MLAGKCKTQAGFVKIGYTESCKMLC